jgi:hypothetical protein
VVRAVRELHEGAPGGDLAAQLRAAKSHYSWENAAAETAKRAAEEERRAAEAKAKADERDRKQRAKEAAEQARRDEEERRVAARQAEADRRAAEKAEQRRLEDEAREGAERQRREERTRREQPVAVTAAKGNEDPGPIEGPNTALMERLRAYTHHQDGVGQGTRAE